MPSTTSLTSLELTTLATNLKSRQFAHHQISLQTGKSLTGKGRVSYDDPMYDDYLLSNEFWGA